MDGGKLNKKQEFRLRRGKGSVSEFVDADGTRYKPGDIVELPENYKGEKWLEVVKLPKPDIKLQELEASPKKPKARKQKKSQ
jgi:hypothetical protein